MKIHIISNIVIGEKDDRSEVLHFIKKLESNIKNNFPRRVFQSFSELFLEIESVGGIVMKKSVTLIKLGVLLVLILSGCSEGLQEETVAKAEGKKQKIVVQTQIQIPVIKDFMPNMNFVPKSNIPTHIVLHFISNAANNPEESIYI